MNNDLKQIGLDHSGGGIKGIAQAGVPSNNSLKFIKKIIHFNSLNNLQT